MQRNSNNIGSTDTNSVANRAGWILICCALLLIAVAICVLATRFFNAASADDDGETRADVGRLCDSALSNSENLTSLYVIEDNVSELSRKLGEAREQQHGDDPEDVVDGGEVNRSLSGVPLPMNLTKDFRSSFVHGSKPAAFQKYIVLHDTEGSGSASSVVNWWDSSGQGVAAHFVVNKDGSIVQCVDMDSIAHHVGFGDTGHNALYGVEDESRDDKVGTKSIGSWASDYGMNSYSIGIELVHVGGEGDYPKAQLEALDSLIAYIDAYYGFESQIIDHKAWRTGNSDTSLEFAPYLQSYKEHRRHDAI